MPTPLGRIALTITALVAVTLAAWALTPLGRPRHRGLGDLAIAATCSGQCRMGDAVQLRASGGNASGWLLVAVTRPSGESFWLFPGDGNGSPDYDPSNGPTDLPQNLRVGSSFAPGTYTIRMALVPEIIEARRLELALFSKMPAADVAETKFTVLP